MHLIKSVKAKFFLLSLLLFISLPVFAQTGREQYKVLGITVEGNKSTDANTIIGSSGLKVDSEIEIPGDQTLNAIKQLWALNIFSDVQIIIDKQVQQGVFLKIKVTEFPRIDKLVFEGNDEISDKKIEEKVSLSRGQTLKPQDIYNIKTKLMGMYEEEGLLSAKIEPKQYTFLSADTVDDELEITWRNTKDFSDEYKTNYKFKDVPNNYARRAKDRILVKFKIDEGDKSTVRKIEFEGNTHFDDGDLKGALKETSEKKWWKFWSGAKLNKKKYEEDIKALGDFYKKNGYRDFEVLSDTLMFYDNNKNVRVHIKVFEGPQYKIRNIAWEGNTVYKDEVLNERLGFKKGDVYDIEKFNRNLRGPNEKQTDVAALYVDNGYLGANFRPVETKIGEDSLDILISVTESNQFRIGRVEIKGNDKTQDNVIRRELYTLPNDYFSRSALMTSIQQLANLSYFNVENLYKEGVDYFPVNDSTVNVTYKVEEKSSDYLNASVGYSGYYGMSGSLGVTLKNFSLEHPFSMGGGQILDFSWQFGVGNRYRTFSLGFTEPWLYGTPTSVGAQVFQTRQDFGNDYDVSLYGGSVTVGRRLRWPDHYFNVQGSFKYQHNDIKQSIGYYVKGKSEQYTVGGVISRRNIDNPIFPSLGSSVALSADLSGGALLPGNLNYYKLDFTAEWYRRLFNTNRITLYLSTTLGYINELDDSTKVRINPYERYMMGGAGLQYSTTPLRGYPDRSVGPYSGGNIQIKHTLELRAALALEPIPFYVLFFAEAGNVFDRINQNTNLFDLKRSAGVGARVMINPIGLIGFDYGYGFDRKTLSDPSYRSDPKWEFHFQFGKGF